MSVSGMLVVAAVGDAYPYPGTIEASGVGVGDAVGVTVGEGVGDGVAACVTLTISQSDVVVSLRQLCQVTAFGFVAEYVPVASPVVSNCEMTVGQGSVGSDGSSRYG